MSATFTIAPLLRCMDGWHPSRYIMKVVPHGWHPCDSWKEPCLFWFFLTDARSFPPEIVHGHGCHVHHCTIVALSCRGATYTFVELSARIRDWPVAPMMQQMCKRVRGTLALAPTPVRPDEGGCGNDAKSILSEVTAGGSS
jgi:hypothetical protein